MTSSSYLALLVFAHYRTQPSDLQHMLDDNHVRIYTLQFKQQILAAVLVNEEGGFDRALSTQIYRGERRPTGHLLAQTLTFHAGCEHASTLRYARVMRIAVHPRLQGNGLGSYLLNEVIAHEQQQDVDAIGTSFGATLELLRFWQHAGFDLVRLGFTRDHASGTHSAVMLKPLNEKGEKVFQETRTRFQRGLDEWLREPLNDLPGEMQAYLHTEQQPANGQLTEMDWQDINSFIHTHRGYEACIGALRRLVIANKEVPEKLDATAQTLIRSRIEQRNSWTETIRQAGMSGKAQALQQLRLAIEKIVKNLTTK
ncbi:MAG: GNAT family N-acetyltransferase [Gammaproteobacteria bacterium]